MYCDLRLPGLQNVLKSYCTDAKDKSLLKIIFFKLLYYYRFRYFSSSLDPFFENILADINERVSRDSKLTIYAFCASVLSGLQIPSVAGLKNRKTRKPCNTRLSGIG